MIMQTNITIIGLGELGASFAMGLREQNTDIRIIGSDFTKSAERLALENKWVDKIEHNLFDAVKDADAVILAIPADQTQKTLELFGQDLKEGTIVLDCCPDKEAAAGWSRRYMKAPENFVGIWTGVNPDRFAVSGDGANAASADYFKGSSLFIAADEKTSAEAIRFVSDLAATLKMECSFTGPLELDGMISASCLLPVMAAYGLTGCISKRSGWADGKKAAGRIFSRMASPVNLKIDQEEPGTAFLGNRENIVRLLNEYIGELKVMRDLLNSRDESGLRKMIEDDKQALEQWDKDYRHSNKRAGEPNVSGGTTAVDAMNQVFFGGFLRKKIRN